MVDLLLSLNEFRNFVMDRPGLWILESRILVVCPLPTGNATILAYKEKPERLFKDSIEFESIGRVCLGMWEQPKEQQCSEADLKTLNYVRDKLGAITDAAFNNLVAMVSAEKERRDRIAALKATNQALSRVT